MADLLFYPTPKKLAALFVVLILALMISARFLWCQTFSRWIGVFGVYIYIYTPGDSKWLFLSPSWRSLKLWKGHLSIPKRSQRIARLLLFFFGSPTSSHFLSPSFPERGPFLRHHRGCVRFQFPQLDSWLVNRAPPQTYPRNKDQGLLTIDFPQGLTKPQFLRGVRGRVAMNRWEFSTPWGDFSTKCQALFALRGQSTGPVSSGVMGVGQVLLGNNGASKGRKLPLCGDFSLVFCRFVDVTDVRC